MTNLNHKITPSKNPYDLQIRVTGHPLLQADSIINKCALDSTFNLGSQALMLINAQDVKGYRNPSFNSKISLVTLLTMLR